MHSKYFIGELGFKTKKDCLSHTRNIINGLVCGKINKDHIQYDFLENLLKNHDHYEEKKGEGIDYFFIIPDPLDKRYFQTWIKRINDTEVVFSWNHCCKFKPRTHTELLTDAMREAIHEDIYELKMNQVMKCNLCKTIDHVCADFHVDHDDPPFREIKENFLKQTNLPIPNIFGTSQYRLIKFTPDDISFKNDWIAYHKNTAVLQILCKYCNFKKH
jgi:hypothetical protein